MEIDAGEGPTEQQPLPEDDAPMRVDDDASIRAVDDAVNEGTTSDEESPQDQEIFLFLQFGRAGAMSRFPRSIFNTIRELPSIDGHTKRHYQERLAAWYKS